MRWTVVGFDPAARAALVDHVDDGTAVEAARRARRARRAGTDPVSGYRVVAGFEGRLDPRALVQDIDTILAAGGAPPLPKGGLARPYTVVAYWTFTGDVLLPAAAHTIAASGLLAMGMVQLRVAPPRELQVVAAFEGHRRPSLTAENLADDW